jgi:hypothetical protein
VVAGALAKLARAMLPRQQPETVVCKQGPGLGSSGVRRRPRVLRGGRQLLEAGSGCVVVVLRGEPVAAPGGTAIGGLVECSRNKCLPRDGCCQVAQGLCSTGD